MKTWLIWQDERHGSDWNMAADEALLASGSLQVPLLRLYGWSRKAATIGYFQKHRELPELQDYEEWTRRPTGGGLVDHRNDFTFTIVWPASHPYTRLSAPERYLSLHSAIAKSLGQHVPELKTSPCCTPSGSRQAYACFTSISKYDLVVGPNKIGGGAQRQTAQGVLHQGSLVIPERLNRDVIGQAMIASMETEGWEKFAPGRSYLEAVENIRSEKYATSDWNHKF